MKFTVALIGLLCISSTWADKKTEDLKGKREAPVSYGAQGHSTHSLQLPQSHGLGEESAISIGAGYSIGGAKPSFSFGGHGDSSPSYQFAQQSQPGNEGHATIRLAPIMLQPEHGSFATGDLSQLMSQIQQGLSSGSLSLQPASSYGHESSASLPQFTYGAPKYQQYAVSEQSQSSPPSYAAGTKGLGSYGSTGPVLFTSTSEGHGSQPSLSFASAGSGHSGLGGYTLGGSGHSLAGLSLGDAGHSLKGLSLGGSGGYSLAGFGQSLGGSGHSLGGAGHSLGGSGHSFGNAGYSLVGAGHSLGGPSYTLGDSGHSLGGGHSFGGHSLGGSGHSLGGASYSLGGSGHSLGGAGHSLGSAGHGLSAGYSLVGGHSNGGPVKTFSSYAPSKTSFKPSAFLGAQGDSAHGLSSSYGSPSFGSSFSGSHGGLSALSSAGHGHSFGSFGGHNGGSAKYVAPSYIPPKSEGYPSADSLSAFSSGSHSSSPPGTTYGTPSASYLTSSNNHGSSSSPQYYVSPKYSSSSFGEGSSAYKGASSSHSSLSSSPKYSFGGHSSSARYASPKDAQGAYSEATYNTIKYSTEMKPTSH